MSRPVFNARNFAIKAHGDQTYSDGEPYSFHLAAVSCVARKYKLSEIIQVAAWLHDVLEDTEVTRKQLEEQFGKLVADLVWAVTDEKGKNRAERAKKTWPKIRCAGRDAVALKLCDRIANVEASIGTSYMKMYEKEYEAFKRALYEPYEGLDEMWNRLDNLFHTPDLD